MSPDQSRDTVREDLVLHCTRGCFVLELNPRVDFGLQPGDRKPSEDQAANGQ